MSQPDDAVDQGSWLRRPHRERYEKDPIELSNWSVPSRPSWMNLEEYKVRFAWAAWESAERREDGTNDMGPSAPGGS